MNLNVYAACRWWSQAIALSLFLRDFSVHLVFASVLVSSGCMRWFLLQPTGGAVCAPPPKKKRSLLPPSTVLVVEIIGDWLCQRAVEGHQPSWAPASALLSRNRRSTAKALQNDLQYATCACFWTNYQNQTPWGRHEGPTSFRGTNWIEIHK